MDAEFYGYWVRWDRLCCAVESRSRNQTGAICELVNIHPPRCMFFCTQEAKHADVAGSTSLPQYTLPLHSTQYSTYLPTTCYLQAALEAGPPSSQASSSIPCREPILIPEVGRDRARLLSPAFLSFRCRHAQPQKASFPYHPPSNWEEGRDGWMDGWMRSPP